MKWLFDRTISLILLVLFLPVLLVIAMVIMIDAGSPVLYRQVRVGRNGRNFRIIKFRTMSVGSDRDSKLTVGSRDPRVTRSGYFLRKYKLDELPQLFNVLVGDMSLVGPRPEVPEYVKLYDDEQKKVLSVLPGITDNASLEYIDENELLSKADDAEKEYREKVMPAKIAINLDYLSRAGFFSDIGVLFRTVFTIFRR